MFSSAESSFPATVSHAATRRSRHPAVRWPTSPLRPLPHRVDITGCLQSYLPLSSEPNLLCQIKLCSTLVNSVDVGLDVNRLTPATTSDGPHTFCQMNRHVASMHT